MKVKMNYFNISKYVIKDIWDIVQCENTLKAKTLVGIGAFVVFLGFAIADPKEMLADYSKSNS